MIKITDKFKIVDYNTDNYSEGSDEWNALVDCAVCEKTDGVSILDMMVYNDIVFSYYANILPKLIADGKLELIEGTEK
jgi:hypothetical protein